MTVSTIEKAWQRIRAWYEEHVTEPPDTDFFIWGKGASDKEIDDAERIIGLTFPTELRESYKLYNGNNDNGLFELGYLMPLREILPTVLMFKESVDEGLHDNSYANPSGPIRQIWWNTKWIPFLHNGGSDYCCVDLDPANGGEEGQVIEFGHEFGPIKILATSFGSFVSQFADELDAGQFKFDPEGGSIKRIRSAE